MCSTWFGCSVFIFVFYCAAILIWFYLGVIMVQRASVFTVCLSKYVWWFSFDLLNFVYL